MAKRLARKHQCKGKDHKEILLVSLVGLLEVVISCPMLATFVVRWVILNERAPLGDNKFYSLKKGNKKVSLVQCLGKIKVGSPDLSVFKNKLHQILVL